MFLVQGDKQKFSHRKLFPIVLILDNLRSAENVGNIFRLAEALKIEKIYALGYTPVPPHPKLKKTARGTEDFVNFSVSSCGVTLLKTLKNKEFNIIGIDTVHNAKCLWNYECNLGKLALIFGNEALGISQNLLKYCDEFISLPMFGFKNSINVSNCTSAVLYHIVRMYCKK